MGHGAQCVTTSGISEMQQSSAVSWGLQRQSVQSLMLILGKEKVCIEGYSSRLLCVCVCRHLFSCYRQQFGL